VTSSDREKQINMVGGRS